MSDQTVKCPKCGKEFPVTEALTQQIVGRLRADFDETASKREREYEQALGKKDQELQAALVAERKRVEAQARSQAQDVVATELQDLRAQVTERNLQMQTARQKELDLLKRQRELEEQQTNLELDSARRLDEERKTIWAQAAAKSAEENLLKMREKELQLEQMRDQIDDLKKKAEQGPQQRQGEVMELVLEDALRAAFRYDEIETVKKGQKGGDILQHVAGAGGISAGTILWELKRTKAWTAGWIPKLKDDQRDAKAEIAVIVTEVLPSEVKTIGNVDGVWVSNFASAMGLATALRANLMSLADVRSALVGQQGKMEVLYGYLSGPQFKHRVEGIVEAFQAMKTDLDAEKRAMVKHWATREKQLEIVLKNTAGMYGDFQGVMGNALPVVQTLELPSGAGVCDQNRIKCLLLDPCL
jgi:hypothetical protein